VAYALLAEGRNAEQMRDLDDAIYAAPAAVIGLPETPADRGAEVQAFLRRVGGDVT
jgi:predicted GTPase